MSCDGREAHIYDVATGRRIHTLSGGYEGVEEATFSRDGTLLLTDGSSIEWGGEREDAARLWDVASGRLLQRYPAGNGITEQPLEIYDALLSIDSRQVVTTTDEWIRMWDVRTGRPRRGFGDDTDYAAYSPDGHLLATGGYGSPLRIRDAKTGRIIRTLRGSREMYSLTFGPDSRLLATTVFDEAEIWDATTGRLLHTLHHDID